MRNSLIQIGLVALSMFALVGQKATRADDEKPVTLAQTIKVGDVYRYKNDFKISASIGDIELQQSRKQTVKEVKDNGDIVAEIASEGDKITYNGSPAPDQSGTPASNPAAITTDKYGKLMTFKADENQYLSASTLQLLAVANRVVFPTKPVKPGDTWTVEMDNPAVKDKKVTLKLTFVGMDKADGADAWKIKQTMEADIDGGGKLTAETTALLDPTNGQMIQADQTIKGVPVATIGPVDWKGTLQRVKPDADKTEKKPANP